MHTFWIIVDFQTHIHTNHTFTHAHIPTHTHVRSSIVRLWASTQNTHSLMHTHTHKKKHTHKHICTFTYTYTYSHASQYRAISDIQQYLNMYTCMYVCVYVCMCICLRSWVSSNIWKCTHVCMYVHMYVYAYVCIWYCVCIFDVHICSCIWYMDRTSHVSIHTFTHTYGECAPLRWTAV